MTISSKLTFLNKFVWPFILLTGGSLILIRIPLDNPFCLTGLFFLTFGLYTCFWAKNLSHVDYSKGEFLVFDGFTIERFNKNQLQKISVHRFGKPGSIDLCFYSQRKIGAVVVRIQPPGAIGYKKFDVIVNFLNKIVKANASSR